MLQYITHIHNILYILEIHIIMVAVVHYLLYLQYYFIGHKMD
jgi:hypothetical protein